MSYKPSAPLNDLLNVSPPALPLAASIGRRNVTVWRPSVRLYVCPVGIRTVTHQGVARVRRGQRTFRPDVLVYVVACDAPGGYRLLG